MLNQIVIRTSAADAALNSSNPLAGIAGQKSYKFYVEPSGNNHTVVRSVIKRRSWFNSVEISQESGWSGQGPKILNLIWTQVRRPRVLRELLPFQIYNHLDGINEVAQKSRLFLNMSKYYQGLGKNPFDYLPETYLVPLTSNFELHPSFKAFRQACSKGSIWIFKPGESSNRGNGIKVFKDFGKIRTHMADFCRTAENKRGQGRHRHAII